MFIGRVEELKTLKERLESSDFEVGIIYGQRRIGKTSLIMESVKEYKYIYFLAKDTTFQDNLNYFSNEFRKYKIFI